MPVSSLSTWKDIFTSNKHWDYSNSLLDKIKTTVSSDKPFVQSFEEISKNPGVTLLSLDPTESQPQLFHHPQIVGGSWTSPDKKMAAVLGFDSDAKPVQLVSKSIKDIKCKSFSVDEFAVAMEEPDSLKSIKNARHELVYKNIVALPYLLTQVFLSLETTDPITVAMAFFHAMYDHDSSLENKNDNDQANTSTIDDSTSEAPQLEDEMSNDVLQDHNDTDSKSIEPPTPSLFLEQFLHVIQFCHLCYKGKITPVFYTLAASPDIKLWYQSLLNSNSIQPKGTLKHNKSIPTSPESDDEFFSPDSKISRKDKHFLSAMLKIHDTLDKNMLRTSKDREEKEPGFARLELHKKTLILNASACLPFEDSATSPTEFYSSFLSKKSQLQSCNSSSNQFIYLIILSI